MYISIEFCTYIQEKALQSDDYGKDLAGVEALQRKHKELEHDLTALEKKLEVKYYIQKLPVNTHTVVTQLLSMEADSLIEEQPSNASLISDKQTEIIDHWERLMEKADQRKQKLEESRQFQSFLSDHRDLVSLNGLSLSMHIRSAIWHKFLIENFDKLGWEIFI